MISEADKLELARLGELVKIRLEVGVAIPECLSEKFYVLLIKIYENEEV